MKRASLPEGPSSFADYQRHLIAYGDPTKLEGAPRGVRVASQDFITKLLQALAKFDPVLLDQFRLAQTSVSLFYLRDVRFTVGEAISVAQHQFAPVMTFVRNGRVSLLQLAAVNDPLYPRQWALQKMEAEPAWQRLAQAARNSVRVAIIDSGIQRNHADFQGLAVVGQNIVSGGGNFSDDVGHGTMLAGTIAAVANNGVGIAGVVPIPPVNFTLMALKFDDVGTPPLAYFAAKAVVYAASPTPAAARRADIINASWHVLDDQDLLRLALGYAQAQNVLVVTAAGNDGSDNTRIPTAPASYALDNMIAVTASDEHDDKVESGNYGATVDIAAPGDNILSTGLYFLNPAYRDYSGTSAAAAHVSAAAALLLTIDNWTPREIRDHLVASADPIPGLSGICRAGGRLNLRRAVLGPFEIVKPSGGERLQRGSLYDVQWSSDYNSPVVNTVEIAINGAPLTPGGGAANTGLYRVTWPNQAIANAVLRLRCVQKNLYAESAPFDII